MLFLILDGVEDEHETCSYTQGTEMILCELPVRHTRAERSAPVHMKRERLIDSAQRGALDAETP